ncbi:MAG: hypothetical protein HWN69_05605 [Desulfobacterales bacterium]|nr:hypothetical protein [Desulfobacterales bacterium]
MKKKCHRAGLIVVFAIAVFLGPAHGYAKAETAEAKSECITCHTDVKKLIRLGWKIEKTRPKPGKSAETAGKG